MGLFDKKYCDICGEKISLLGNRKLNDGNMCSKCAKLISPFFEDRRHTSLNEMKEHLAYREENKTRLATFCPTETYGDSQMIYIDRPKNCFVVTCCSPGSWEKENPDVIPISEVVSCNLDVREDRHEEYTKDSQGNRVSYNPPRYRYEYDFYVNIVLSGRWFSNIQIKLNTFDVDGQNTQKYYNYQTMGQQIVSALTGAPCNVAFRPNNGANVFGGGIGGSVAAGIAGAFANQVIQNQHQNQMQQQMSGGVAPVRKIKCTNCGVEIEANAVLPKFCPSCGDPIDLNDVML